MHEHDPENPHIYADLQSLAAMSDRRRVLVWLASAACVTTVACVTKGAESGGGDSTGAGDDTSGSGDTTAAGDSTDGTCSTIPEETAGPYPGDGSNGPDALALSDIVRSDIRSSIGTASGTAAGIPMVLRLKVVDASGCAPLAGYAVYVWHCDRDGNYSMYTAPDENYLRGVQVTDADGEVTFTSIFPACYSGRWPHVHFEVYASVDAIDSASNAVATSQLALPAAACDEVFATTGYEDSVQNFASVSLESDMVFGDGAELETPTVTGDTTSGYVAHLQIGVGVR